MSDEHTRPADEDHLAGCPAALSIPGARDECRCAELAALFGVPTREECFGAEDPAQARARWRAVRAEAARRSDEVMRDLLADEERALERYRETASHSADLERDIRTARQLVEQERRIRGLI